MPSLPEPPDDQSENRAWIDEQAERVAVLARTQLRKIVLRAYDAYLSTLTAAGDLAAFDSIPQEWGVFVGEQLLDEIDGVYRSGAVAAWNQAPTTAALGESAALAWAAVVNEDAVSYAAQASNRLAGVGHDIWMKVNSEVTEAIRQGTGTEALKNEIERLTGFSEFRADTIARTEIGSAFVNGNYEAQVALGEYGAVFKEWLSVSDARTRPEHAALDGTVIPFDDMFDAGGEMMRAPHDETASAGNVINCRCDVLWYYPGDTLPDGTLVQAPGAEPDSDQGTAGPEIAEEVEQIAAQQVTEQLAATTYGPGPLGDRNLREAFDILDGAPARQANVAGVLDEIARIHGLPTDMMANTVVRFGGKADLKGGHFSPATRGPKPRKKRGETTAQWNARANEYLSKPLQPEIFLTQAPDIADEAFTLAHEVGHRTDWDGRRFRTQDMWRSGELAQLSRRYGPTWMEHLDEVIDPEARAYGEIGRLAREAQSMKDYSAGARVEFRQYFYSIEEVWARAYSQWVAEVSGNETLVRGLRRMQEKGYQFTDEEFAQIRPHVEAVLRARGLLKEATE